MILRPVSINLQVFFLSTPILELLYFSETDVFWQYTQQTLTNIRDIFASSYKFIYLYQELHFHLS